MAFEHMYCKIPYFELKTHIHEILNDTKEMTMFGSE